MVEDVTNSSDLLAPDEPISEKNSLGYEISIHVNPETREIETIVSNGPFGPSEYDPKAEAWIAMGIEETWRLRDLENNSVIYKVNWKNDNDFDENDDCITLKKYSDGTLNEEYLKENAIEMKPLEE